MNCRCVLLALTAFATGCDAQRAPQVEQSALADAALATPPDARLAALYNQSCKACHAVANSGAPLARDRAAWDARWSKGLPALMRNVVTGMNGMPAGGQCFACTPLDYEALIKFLAAQP